MKKPINRVAIALWVLAVLTLASEAASWAYRRQILQEATSQPGQTYYVVGHFWPMIRASALAATLLAAFGYLIELIDQIRWNALHRSDHRSE
jgi:hypothetical protein